MLVPARTRVARPAALTAVAALALGLSGCAGGAEADADEPLTYWATNNGSSVSDDQAVLERELAAFTEETGVEVDVEVVPWSDLLSRIQTAVATGEGPDVVNIGNTWAAALQATGAFLPFDDDVIAEIGGWDRYAAPALTANGADGETPISVPLYNFVEALYYNKAVLADAGVTDPPATWDELVDAAERITADTDGDGTTDRYGLTFEPSTYRTLWGYANQLDGDVLEGDDPALDDPAVAEALAEVASWWGEDGIVDPAGLEITAYTEAVQRLIDGDAGFLIAQTGEQTFANLGFTDDDYGVVPVPVLDPLPEGGQATTSAVGGTSVAVFADTDQRDASVDLVRFLSSTEVSTALTQAFGATSPVVEAQSDDAFQSPVAQTLAGILNDSAEGQPQIAAATQLESALDGAVTSVVTTAATTGSVSDAEIADALSAAQDEFEATR